MTVIRLIDIPAVRQFEDKALLSPELRSVAGATRSAAFDSLARSLFGISMAEFGPVLPDGYEREEDGEYYYVHDHDETPEDLAAWARFERDLEIIESVYGGLTARSDASLLELLLAYSWDATDKLGRALNCMVPLAPMLVASARGDFGIPKLGQLKVSASDWGTALAEEAAKFQTKRPRK